MKASELKEIAKQVIKDINEEKPKDILNNLSWILKNVASKGQTQYEYGDEDLNIYPSVRTKVITVLKQDGFKVTWDKNNPYYLTINW